MLHCSRCRETGHKCDPSFTMKVDKGVCTCDIYFNGTQDSIIKFENVLTTLVENKILAIKRECEENEGKKKTRNLKQILLRKHDVKHDANQPATDGDNDEKVFTIASKKKRTTDEGENSGSGSNTKSSFFKRFKSRDKSQDIEFIEKGNDEVVTNVGELAKFEIQNDNSKPPDTGINGVSVGGIEPITTVLDSKTNDNDLATTSNQLSAYNNREIKTQCDNAVVNEPLEGAKLTQNSSFDNNNCCYNRTLNNNNAELLASAAHMQIVDKANASVADDDVSLATTADLSLQQQSSVVLNVVVAAAKKCVQLEDEKASDLAICDDASSQNTSDMEFSLVSDHVAVAGIPTTRKKSLSAYSDHGSVSERSNAFVSSLPLARKKQSIERKAMSCQSTPLFGRHARTTLKSHENHSEPKKVLKFDSELVKDIDNSRKYSNNNNEVQKSQTVVIASTNATSPTTTTTVADSSEQRQCDENSKSRSSRVVPISMIASENHTENRVVLIEDVLQTKPAGEALKKAPYDEPQPPCEKRRTKSKIIPANISPFRLSLLKVLIFFLTHIFSSLSIAQFFTFPRDENSSIIRPRSACIFDGIQKFRSAKATKSTVSSYYAT